eukprot:CCRYP_014551-RA/>CCRYP_014551-RA protein AED:0.48 eAED:0.48 QI:0/-1/0/1/-1/1/1/0/76
MHLHNLEQLCNNRDARAQLPARQQPYPQCLAGTAGHTEREGHSSATCANKAEGHKDTATRANMMGDSMVNKGWESK